MKKLVSPVAIAAVVAVVLGSATLTAVSALTPVSARAAGSGGQGFATRTGGTAAIYDCAGDGTHSPSQLVLFCGDGNDTLSAVRWTGWGGTVATATATDEINLCQPSCAGGHDHGYGVRVNVDDLKGRGKAARYTSLTVTFTTGRPKGQSRVQRFDLTSHGPVVR